MSISLPHNTLPVRYCAGIVAVLLSGALAAQGVCSITLGPDQVICQGQNALLQGPPGFANYQWSNGAITQNTVVGTAGTYTCQVSYPSGQLVTNGNFDQGNTGFSTDFTYNTNLNLGDGHYWVGTNAASHHPNFFGTGTGNFMIVNAGWAAALFMVWCQDVTVCPNQTYTLSYRARTVSNSTPARLQWWINGAPVGPEVNLPAYGTGWQQIDQVWTSPAVATTATICLRAMSGEGAGNDFGLDDISMSGTIVLTDDIVVDVTPLPVVDLGPTQTLCSGETALLDATVPGGSYLWQDNSTNATYTVNSAGNYSVVVTANGCSNTDQVTVNYNPLPVVDLGADQTLCAGDQVVLNATIPGATYLWQDGSTGPTFTVSGPGTYSVDVLLNGCSASDAVDINYNPLPVVDLGPDQTVCAGDQVVLDATVAGATYLWQDGSTDPTFTVTGPGNYNVVVVLNGCTAIDAVNFDFNPLPLVDLGGDQFLCAGEQVILDATVPGATYLWQDGSTAPSFTVSGPGNYAVDVLLNGCSTSDAVNINYNPLPVVDLGDDQTQCADAPVTLDATVPGATYLWQDGSADATFTTATSGTYDVEVFLNGCSSTDQVELTFIPLPVVDLGPDQSVCPGTDVILNAFVPGATYLWQDNSTGAGFTATSPGTYSVSVTANGCSASDAMEVFHFALPPVNLGADVTICAGSSTTLNANVFGATYLWNTGAATQTISTNTAGTYWVDVTQNGCAARDSIIVNVTPLPVVDLGPDPSVCPGDLAVLDATYPGATYVWNTGATSATITVGPGNYLVQVSVNGCSTPGSVAVLALPPAQVDLGNDTTLCPGDQLVLDATQAGADHVWQDGSTNATFTVSSDGNYSVTLTDANGCVATDAIDVSYFATQPVDLGPDVSICAGDQLVLDATVPGAGYLWSTGAVTPTIAVTQSGVISVTVTQGACQQSDAIDVQVVNAPVVDLGPDVTLCPGEQMILDATAAGVTYLWSTGAISPTITVSLGGTYDVTLTNAAGCTATDVVSVVIASPGAVDLGSDIILCAGESATLDATLPGATYTWSNGAITPTLSVTTAGTYWVEVAQGLCSVSDTVTVAVLPVPQVDLGTDLTLCDGESVILDATWPGADHLWSTGESTPTITVSTAGTYDVIVDLDGCIATDIIAVAVITTNSLNLGGDQTICAGDQVLLDATTPGSTYTWSTGDITPTLTVSTSGTYWVEVAQGLCSVSDTVTITVLPSPAVDLGGDIALCDGETAVLDATVPGASYLWSTGDITPTIAVSTSGNYSVTVALGGCSTSDAVEVTVGTISSLDLGGDQSLCLGDQLILDATIAGASYLWSTGAVSPTLTVTAAGTYWVEALFGACSATDTVTITVVDPGTIDLGPDVQLCAGGSLTLDANLAGATYLWNDGSTGATLTVTTTDTYSVVATVDQCTVTDAVLVTFDPLPVVDIGPDVELCPGEVAVFDATTPGATYLWGAGSSAAIFSTQEAGPVDVVVTVNGCTGTDQAMVILLNGPTVSLGTDTTLCDGASLLIDLSNPDDNFLWEDGSTNGQRIITDAGTYWVQVERNGCTASDTLVVQLFLPTSINLGGDATLCPGGALTLDATTAGATYTWSTGSTASAITVTEDGSYWVHVLVSGCIAQDTVTVTTVVLPEPDLGADLTICEGESVALSVDPGTYSVVWSTGSTAPSITVTSSGVYGVTLSSQGCTTGDVVQVTVEPTLGEIDLGDDRDLCPGNSIVLDATISAGASYLWNTGSTDAMIQVEEPGVYSVIATGNCGETSAVVIIGEGDCDVQVHVPNTFTPNGDGLNEVFHAVVDGSYDTYRMDIFNRWGELIFTSLDPLQGWDGRSFGSDAPDGVYVWTVNWTAITSLGIKQDRLVGHVTLLR